MDYSKHDVLSGSATYDVGRLYKFRNNCFIMSFDQQYNEFLYEPEFNTEGHYIGIGFIHRLQQIGDSIPEVINGTPKSTYIFRYITEPAHIFMKVSSSNFIIMNSNHDIPKNKIATADLFINDSSVEFRKTMILPQSGVRFQKPVSRLKDIRVYTKCEPILDIQDAIRNKTNTLLVGESKDKKTIFTVNSTKYITYTRHLVNIIEIIDDDIIQRTEITTDYDQLYNIVSQSSYDWFHIKNGIALGSVKASDGINSVILPI